MSYSMSLNLNPRQGQSLKQTQRLIMSPQMQQAIQMLQMSVMELEQAVDAEMEQNPVLEYSEEVDRDNIDQMIIEAQGEEPKLEGDAQAEKEIEINDRDFEVMKHLDEEFSEHFAQSGSPPTRTKQDAELQSFLESSLRRERTLTEALSDQARESFECTEELRIAEEIIGSLDERGFYEDDLKHLAELNGWELEAVEDVFQEIQEFDPPGVCARNVQESLLIQLRRNGKARSLAYAIVSEHFEDLLHNRIPAIQKGLGADPEAIESAVARDIRPLDLQPGAGYGGPPAQQVVPDGKIRDEQGVLSVEVNDSGLPPLRLNRRYMRMLEDPNLASEDRDYITKKAMSGKWLLKNIHQRNDTLRRILESLTRRQSEYLSEPNGELKPLTMKAVAEELEVHESTVARAVANKYVDCPRGLVALRFFFSNSYVSKGEEDVSSHSVKTVLRTLIDDEDKCKPLSDEVLSKAMKTRGIDCARRTVAKYRREMNIGNTTQRRSYVVG